MKYTHTLHPILRALFASAGAAWLAGLAFVIAATPVQASDVRQTLLFHADLDLTHPAGQETLNRRINAAARRVCGPYLVTEKLQLRTDAEDCMAKAMAEARQRVLEARLNRQANR
jgi:UrcA family protein